MEQKKRKWFEDDVPYISKVDKILQEMDFSLAQQVAEHVGQGEEVLQKTKSQTKSEKPEQNNKELKEKETETKELSQLERRKLQRKELKRETVRERQQEIKKEESAGEKQVKEEKSAQIFEKRFNSPENTKVEMSVIKRQAIRPASTLRRSVLDDLPEPKLQQERDKKIELESKLQQKKEEKAKPKLESQQKTEHKVKTEKDFSEIEHKSEPEKEKDITYVWGGQREESDSEEYTERKEMPLFGKVLIALAVCLLIIACGAIYYANYVLDQANIVDAAKEDIYIPVQEETFERDKMPVGSNKEVIDPEEVLWGKLTRLAKKQENVINLLLVGEERLGESENGRGRTDCMMIATISKKEKALKLTSLMRDMYVQIPGYSDNKLNAAYRNGGISLLEETIKVNFGVEVDGYVLVNFDSFEDVINVLGGVEMKLSEVEAEYLNHKNYISKKKYRNVKAGKQVLNGNQALGYARVRYVRTANGLTDDWGRNDRQRRLLKAVFKKYKSKSALELVELLPDILSLVTTDLSKKDMLTYIGAILNIHADKLETMSIPIEGSYSSPNINGMSVLLPNLETNSQELHKFLFGEEEEN